MCKREIVHIRLGHIQLQWYSAWIDKAKLSEIMWTKVRISEKVYKQLLLGNEEIQVTCKI